MFLQNIFYSVNIVFIWHLIWHLLFITIITVLVNLPVYRASLCGSEVKVKPCHGQQDCQQRLVERTIRYRTPRTIRPADGATNILIKKHQKKTWFSPKVLQGSLKPVSLLTLLLQLIVISLWLKNSSGQLLWQPWTIRPLFSCFTWVGTVLSTEAKVREKYMSDMVVESWTALSKVYDTVKKVSVMPRT